MSKLALSLTAILLMFPLAAHAQQGFGTNAGFGGTTGAVTLLEGGVNGVADTYHPGDTDEDGVFDDPVPCEDRCRYKTTIASGGGAVFDSALNDAAEVVWINGYEVLARFRWEAFGANFTNDAYDVARCIIVFPQGNTDDDTFLACSARESQVPIRDAFLAYWRWMPAQASAGVDACDIRMATSFGSVEVTGTEFTIGLTATTFEVPVHGLIQIEVDEGNYNFMGRNGGGGSGCPSAALCVCENGEIDGAMELMGVKYN